MRLGSFFQAYRGMNKFFWFTTINQNKKAVDLCKYTKTTARERCSHRPTIFLKCNELPRTMQSMLLIGKTNLTNNFNNK